MPDRLNHRLEALVKKLLGDDQGLTPISRRSEVFSTDPQKGRKLTDAWDGVSRPNTVKPSGGAPVTLDVEKVLSEVYAAARGFDEAADRTLAASTSAEHAKGKEAQAKARDALFNALLEAVESILAFADARLKAAGQPAVWGELADLGLYPLTETLCMRDAPSYLSWDWMLRWKDSSLTTAAALERERQDRARCCRLVELHSYVYRLKFGATLNALAEKLPETSWLARAGAALKAAPMGDDPIAGYARQKFASALFQAPPGVVDLSSAPGNGEAVVAGAKASWVNVKQMNLETNPNLDNMRAALLYRKRLVDSLLVTVLNSVMAQTPAQGRQFVSFVAPGSATLTSDVDISLKGTDTASVVQAFNREFTEKYPFESGYVLDVNVYAQDYIPDPGWRFLAEDRPGADLDFHGSAARAHLKRVVEHQDMLALLKIRRFVTDESQWTALINSVASGLNKGLKASFTEIATSTDSTYAAVNQQLAKARTTASAAIEQRTGQPAPEGAVEIAAANRLYEALCLEAEEKMRTCRDPSTGANERDDLLESWWKTQGVAQFFANEAYHTAGAMRYVVDVMQSQNPRRTRLAELRDAFNEQLGDCLKELGHVAHAGGDLNPDPNHLDRPSALEKKVNKYIARMGHIALSMLVAVVHQLTQDGVMSQSRAQRAQAVPDSVKLLIPRVSAIAAYGDALVAIKEGRPVNNLAELRQAAGFTSADALVSGLLDAGRDINVAIRNHSRQTDLFNLPTLGDSDEVWEIL